MIELIDELEPDDILDEWLFERMRMHRNRLVAECDWTQAADDPSGNAPAWAEYRQTLRDFPATWTPSPTVDFPDPPT